MVLHVRIRVDFLRHGAFRYLEYFADPNWGFAQRALSPNNGVMRLRLSWLWLALACPLVACDFGGDPAESPLSAGSSGAANAAGAAGAPSGGASTAGGAAGVGGLASAGGATGGSVSAPPMACSSYADKTGYQLVVRIENKMSRTLYLGQDEMSCQAQRLFKVQDGARAELPSLDGCHTSCDQMMASGPVLCPLVCESPATIQLDPGQSLQLPWDGRFGVMQTLPASCLKTAQANPATCVQADRIVPAIFTFSARAGSSRQCLDPSGTCTCAPNQAGGCKAASSLMGGTIYTTEYLVKLEPGETSPGGDAPYIGLVFKDAAQ